MGMVGVYLRESILRTYIGKLVGHLGFGDAMYSKLLKIVVECYMSLDLPIGPSNMFFS
jgi:hypothetical protein